MNNTDKRPDLKTRIVDPQIKTDTQECQNLSLVLSTNNSLNIPLTILEDQPGAQQISVIRTNSKTLNLESQSEDDIRIMETDNIVYVKDDGGKKLNVTASSVVTLQPDVVKAVQYNETDSVQAVQYDESDIVQAVQYETDSVKVVLQAVQHVETATVQAVEYNETDSVQTVQYDKSNTISSERTVYISDTKRLDKGKTKNLVHCAQFGNLSFSSRTESLAHCAQSESLAHCAQSESLAHCAQSESLAHSTSTENVEYSAATENLTHCAQSENLAHCESEIEEEETHYVEILSVESLDHEYQASSEAEYIHLHSHPAPHALACYLDQHQENRSPFTDQHQAAQSPFTDQHQAAKSPFIDQHQAAQSPFTDQHQAAQSPFTDQHQAAQSPLTDQHQAAKSPFTDQHQAAKSPFTDQHQAAQSPFTDQHQAAQSPFIDQHQAAQSPFTDQHQAAKSPFTDQHEAAQSPFTDQHQAAQSPFTDQHQAAQSPFRDQHQAAQSPFRDQKNQHLSVHPDSHSASKERDHHSPRIQFDPHTSGSHKVFPSLSTDCDPYSSNAQCAPHFSSSHQLTHGDPHSSSLHQLTRSPSAPYSSSQHDPHSLSLQCAPMNSTTVQQEDFTYNEPASAKTDPPVSLQYSIDTPEVAKTPLQTDITSQSTTEDDVIKEDLSLDNVKDSKNAEEQPNLNFINALSEKYKIYTKDEETLVFLNSSGLNGLEEGICIRYGLDESRIRLDVYLNKMTAVQTSFTNIKEAVAQLSRFESLNICSGVDEARILPLLNSNQHIALFTIHQVKGVFRYKTRKCRGIAEQGTLCSSCQQVFCNIFHLNSGEEDEKYSEENNSEELEDLISDCELPKRRRFSCKHCIRVFNSLKSLEIHLRNIKNRTTSKSSQEEEQEDERLLPGLEINYKTKADSKKITSIETSCQRFNCHICGKIFKASSTLWGHIKTHENGNFICTICGASFRVKSYLHRHLLTHDQNKKKYECDICKEKFTRPYLMRQHKQFSHFKDLPFKCDECGKLSRTLTRLKIHIRAVHSKEKPFPCEVCGFRSSRMDNLNKHRTKIHDLKNKLTRVQLVDLVQGGQHPFCKDIKLIPGF
ncbi:uncharacterized protein LOC111707663 isoform X4 [Eurytemora carolleeae]|uniref:uncharacterized protein LOC111707663 isoform X4 n=1 Tax=Eurytemora carolleeae TaxID=1294199 RepID=UPI000C77B918|nr:uncharacterized protein LOC111707663 isoform X4 [Eurytemora carolleeae]|eukprot:XP_023336568.1 uncharacterized protein LOC111707663 isoform X4 [Eurytemora affinis]